jgi:hypothetical protein
MASRLNVNGLVQQYAIPALLGFLEGKTEAQYHAYMRTRPDFIATFQRNHGTVWNMIMNAAPRYRGCFSINPDLEARRVCAIVHSKGWSVRKSEYFLFRDNISRLVSILQSQ